ncbi:MAG: heavy metal-associated domain-containing protein [Kiritimatiellia bacterium]
MTPSARHLLPVLAAVLALLPGCVFRPEERTIRIQVPGMRSPACAKALEAKLNSTYKRQTVSYITRVQADPAAGTVVITYNPNTVATLNLLHTIGETGFDATFEGHSVKGDPAGRIKLPPECR